MSTTSLPTALVAIIGGSGLYKIDGLTDITEVLVETPFGLPSDKIVVGQLEGVPVAFLARHGMSHHLTPSEVNYRANIYALKKLGVQYILSCSAVGSLKEDVAPMDFLLCDQFIDRTTNRVSTFFGEGIVAHVPMADPICPKMKSVVSDAITEMLAEAPEAERFKLHNGGTYVCIEGPAFSTKAESFMYRQWNGTVIGMTNVTEAKLAREAEIAYASVCMITDFDCWHPDHDSVTVEMVIGNLVKNAENARKVVKAVVKKIGATKPESDAHTALKYAIMTPKDKLPKQTVQKLDLFIGKYFQ